MGGRPRIAGRRVSVANIAILYERHGWPVERIVSELDLTPAEIHAALAYYHDHKAEIEQTICEDVAHVKEVGISSGDLRAAILARSRRIGEDALHEVMTPAEVAEAFSITPDAVYKAIQRGTVEARQSGGAWLIRRSDAEARWGKNKA
jgi:excisionase family DNA binding protein